MAQPIRLPEILTDGIVVLDSYKLSDAQAHWEGEDAEMLRRFEAVRQPTLDETRSAIQRWANARISGIPNFCYAVRSSGGVLVGGCEVRWLTAANALGISYWCYPRFRRRGFIGRAVILMLGALPATGADQIEAHMDSDNAASRKVAEQAGFVEQGTVISKGKARLRYVRKLS